MIVNSDNLRTFFTASATAFAAGLGSVQPMYGRVAMTVPSSTRANEYGWLGRLPSIREWVGDRVIETLAVHDYTIRNRKWESTVSVLREEIEDDNIGMLGPSVTELGRSVATFPDRLVWGLLRDGFTTPCYDRQPFFDADHPVIGEDGQVRSVSNTSGGDGPAWFLFDTSRAVKPLIFQSRRAFELRRMDGATDEDVFMRDEYRYGVDGRCNVGFGFWQLAHGSKRTLDPESYEAARTALTSMTGDHGRPLGILPNLLVVPPSLEGAGRRLLQSQLVNGGESNPWAGTAELLVVPWLAGGPGGVTP